jgi:hypothetical protein
MNDAEAKRDKRIARMTDHDLLNLLLADATGGVRPDEHKAFGEMRRWVADDSAPGSRRPRGASSPSTRATSRRASPSRSRKC